MLANLLGGAIAALLTGLFAWLAAKATGRAQVDAKKVEQVGPQWESFSQKIMERMDAQQKEIDGLKQEVETLRERVEAVSQKYWRAVLALRRIFDRNPKAIEDAQLPDDLHEDVFDG